MLSIFKSYEAKTSILDDFYYYDDREAKMQERRERQNGLKAQPQSKQVSSDFWSDILVPSSLGHLEDHSKTFFSIMLTIVCTCGNAIDGLMGIADWFVVLSSLLINVPDFFVVKQVNKTQNGCSNSESEKEVEREKGDITEGEEADKGHLIISPEVVVGEERGAADEVVENVKKEKNEGGEPDSMIDTMASIKLSS